MIAHIYPERAIESADEIKIAGRAFLAACVADTQEAATRPRLAQLGERLDGAVDVPEPATATSGLFAAAVLAC